MNALEHDRKEFLVIQGIAANPSVTQRDLAKQAGLSLGSTNIALKRLVRRGSVAVHALNANKIEYRLTRKGAIEKANMSFAQASRSYLELKEATASIRANILQEYGCGLREFVIAASRELEPFVREAIASLRLPEAAFKFEASLNSALQAYDVVFTTFIESGLALKPGQRVIPILEPHSEILCPPNPN